MARARTYSFMHSDEPEPHFARTKKILAAHPEIRKLFGNYPLTALYLTGIVGLQTLLALTLAHSPLWMIGIVAYIVGAVANHSLWVIIHECTHNLVFKGSTGNRLAGILANLPILFPAAISFRKYHLLHHRHQGEMDLDADLPGRFEANLIGQSRILKTLWLLFFFVVESLRPLHLKRIKLWDRWTAFNFVVEVSYVAAILHFAGGLGLLYLFISSVFGIGLHPVGARWIQEHYVIVPGQETYSYYGPLNKLAFNVGYHNEHHDLMMVAWPKLPQVRAMASEFYDPLYSHRSWTGLMLKFIFSGNLNLYSRVIRESGTRRARNPETHPSSSLRVQRDGSSMTWTSSCTL